MQHFKQLDFIGATLFIGGLTLLLFGLNSGGALFVWASAGVIVSFPIELSEGRILTGLVCRFL